MKDIFFSRKFAALVLDAIIVCILLFALFCSPTAVRAQEVVIDSLPKRTSWLEAMTGRDTLSRFTTEIGETFSGPGRATMPGNRKDATETDGSVYEEPTLSIDLLIKVYGAEAVDRILRQYGVAINGENLRFIPEARCRLRKAPG